MATQPKAKVVIPDFTSVLDSPASEAIRPRPLPQGTYVCMIRGMPRYDKSTKKGTDFAEFTLQIMEACEDVDQEVLKETLTKADGEVTALKDFRPLRLTFYLTEDAKYRLPEFLDRDLGIPLLDEDGKKRSYREANEDAPGKMVLAHVKHTPSPDGETMYANIDRTARYIA